MRLIETGHENFELFFLQLREVFGVLPSRIGNNFGHRGIRVMEVLKAFDQEISPFHEKSFGSL